MPSRRRPERPNAPKKARPSDARTRSKPRPKPSGPPGPPGRAAANKSASNKAAANQAARPQSRGKRRPENEAAGERLQKVLAAAGHGSRRKCEELILEGRVEVDREVVTQLGTRVDPQTQEIRVDGTPLKQRRKFYYLLNKPTGVVSTNRDPEGRPRVIDLIRSDERLFTVGRLDMFSEGLIVVTNDGELANRLTHPRYGIDKTYQVTVAGLPEWDELQKLKKGVWLAEGVARVKSLKILRRHGQSTELEIVLDEGRNREIRRVLAKIGHKVMRLKRVAMGSLRLGDLPSGVYRELTRSEIARLERPSAVEPTSSSKPKSDKPATAQPATTQPATTQSATAQPAKAKPAKSDKKAPAKSASKPSAEASVERVALDADGAVAKSPGAILGYEYDGPVGDMSIDDLAVNPDDDFDGASASDAAWETDGDEEAAS